MTKWISVSFYIKIILGENTVVVLLYEHVIYIYTYILYNVVIYISINPNICIVLYVSQISFNV
jgi:hypothetical protein